jgi:hypothetical protein
MSEKASSIFDIPRDFVVDARTDKFPTWNVFCPLPLDTLPLCSSQIIKSCLNI